MNLIPSSGRLQSPRLDENEDPSSSPKTTTSISGELCRAMKRMLPPRIERALTEASLLFIGYRLRMCQFSGHLSGPRPETRRQSVGALASGSNEASG